MNLSSPSVIELVAWRKEWKNAHRDYQREVCDELEARLENETLSVKTFPDLLQEGLRSPSRIWERALYLHGTQQGYQACFRAVKCRISDLPHLEEHLEESIFPAIYLYFESEAGKSIQDSFWLAKLIALMPPYALPLSGNMAPLKYCEFLSPWSPLV